jgi:ABC-type protease/lipase transport system fused ATPase/permease subunit
VQIKIKAFFAWFDMWIGAYWSKESQTLYICPLPMCVIAIVLTSAKADMIRSKHLRNKQDWIDQHNQLHEVIERNAELVAALDMYKEAFRMAVKVACEISDKLVDASERLEANDGKS